MVHQEILKRFFIQQKREVYLLETPKRLLRLTLHPSIKKSYSEYAKNILGSFLRKSEEQ